MSARFLVALPLLLAAALLAISGVPVYWPLAFAVIALVSIVVRARVSVSTFGALLWMIAGASPAVLWARTTTADIGLALPAALLFLGIASVRLFLEHPLFGRNFDRALICFVAIAEGIGVKGAAYPFAAVAIAVALLVENAGGFSALRAFTRSPRAGASVVVLAIAIAALTAVALPAIDRATNRRFQALFEGRMRRSAFSPHVRLDQPGLISQSDEIVLRLHGAETDHLRGTVFDTFDGSYWSTSQRGAPSALSSSPRGELTYVDAAEPSRFLFAPRGTQLVGDTPWEADAFGVLRPTSPRGATTWAFAASQPERLDPPGDDDLQLRPSLAEKVRPLALEWTAGAPDDAARADAITRHLTSDFTYTLDRPAPPPGASPLLDFLFVHRAGHCEFFASAFVVLARSIGIPARLVAGFRVVEHNGFGGYAIVRAKHAHAWGEAYVTRSGATHFMLFDPTPAGVDTLEETDTRSTAAFFDYLKWSIGILYDAAVASPERSIPVLLGIIVLAFIARAIRNRRRRRTSAADDRLDLPPLPFVRFEAMLAKQGFIRDRAETLEAWAVRLDHADRAALARALRRYAGARYGPGSASERELTEALDPADARQQP